MLFHEIRLPKRNYTQDQIDKMERDAREAGNVGPLQTDDAISFVGMTNEQAKTFLYNATILQDRNIRARRRLGQ